MGIVLQVVKTGWHSEWKDNANTSLGLMHQYGVVPSMCVATHTAGGLLREEVIVACMEGLALYQETHWDGTYPLTGWHHITENYDPNIHSVAHITDEMGTVQLEIGNQYQFSSYGHENFTFRRSHRFHSTKLMRNLTSLSLRSCCSGCWLVWNFWA
jgi:hypothetical protein